jgi:hypothetical protein
MGLQLGQARSGDTFLARLYAKGNDDTKIYISDIMGKVGPDFGRAFKPE